MPRPKRPAPAGYCYHVLNRGNARQQVFHKQADYSAFVRLLDEAHARCPMRVLAYRLLPNHFHLVLWPRRDGDLSRWMQWLQTMHVRRYHEHYHTSGHVWQGRFMAFPFDPDGMDGLMDFNGVMLLWGYDEIYGFEPWIFWG